MRDQSTIQDRPLFSMLAAQLKRCGWQEQPLEILEGDLFFRTFQGDALAPCVRFENQKGQHLLLLGLEQVILPTASELFPTFLNLPLESRMALSVARLLGEPDWLLLLTEDAVELYRLPEEAIEQRAGSMSEFEEELLPSLAALARGREAGLSSGPSHLPEAESLRGWLRHWTMHLAAQLKADPAAVERMIWKWIVMLQAARRTEASEVNGGWGLACERRDGHWIVSYNAVSATEELGRALDLFDQAFATKLFIHETSFHKEWLAQLEETSLMDRLRAELLMQTQSRFEPETVAWMFTDLAREQEGWRREVGGLEPIRQRLSHDGWNIFRPLTCDVGLFGLTAALRDTDRLAQYLNDQSLYICQRRLEDPAGTLSQPDLFCQNPRGIGLTGTLDDGLNFLFGEALRLGGVEPERRFGVGVTFLLKALALLPKMEWPFLGLDTLDRLFG